MIDAGSEAHAAPRAPRRAGRAHGSLRRLGDARAVRGRDPRAPRRPPRCGVFDVSHMGQLHVEGPRQAGCCRACSRTTSTASATARRNTRCSTNERGGIVDDLIAYRHRPRHYLLVVNAGNRQAAFDWLKEREIRGSEVRDASDEYALLAVQGPTAIERLGLAERARLHPRDGRGRRRRGDGLPHGLHGRGGRRADVPGRGRRRAVGRGRSRAATTPCGLGARDTLRLEVCYPLHGNDITEETDAISAGLGWTCALDKEFTGVERAAPDQGRGAAAQARRRS